MNLTDSELLMLKELTQKAKPFPGDSPRTEWEDLTEEDKERVRANVELFEAAYLTLEGIIDELLTLRKKVRA